MAGTDTFEAVFSKAIAESPAAMSNPTTPITTFRAKGCIWRIVHWPIGGVKARPRSGQPGRQLSNMRQRIGGFAAYVASDRLGRARYRRIPIGQPRPPDLFPPVSAGRVSARPRGGTLVGHGPIYPVF